MAIGCFYVTFADKRLYVAVTKVQVSSTYEGGLEGSYVGATECYLPELEERRALIESGRLKGYYCFEPDLIDDIVFDTEYDTDGKPYEVKRNRGKCLKSNKVSATLKVDDEEGMYEITLEWYQSIREMMDTPLWVLIQQKAGRLDYDEIKRYCKFYTWDELG